MHLFDNPADITPFPQGTATKQIRVFSLPDVSQLEERILMSATPLDEGVTELHEEMILFAPLSGGEGGEGEDFTPPTALGLEEVAATEDANNFDIVLSDFFVDDLDQDLSFEIVANTNAELFTSGFPLVQGSRLILDYADDAFGTSTLTVRATDDHGNSTEDSFVVTLFSYNDRPTTTGLFDITVDEDSSATVIDLFDSFDDVEDADNELVFSITQNTNPDLFSSIVLDNTEGTLTFHYAPDAFGSSQITVRATDTEGAFVEMGVSGADFGIHGHFGASTAGSHYPDLPYDPLALWTHWYFFESIDGVYNFDNIDEAHLRTQLQNHPAGVPISVDIEIEHIFNNTPEGRDRFAEIFQIMRDERPDLDFGLYRIMPGHSWPHPVHAYRATEDLNRGLATYYSNNATQWYDNLANWQFENDRFHNEPVSVEFGGRPLAEMVNVSYPRLYTPYRDDTSYGPISVDVDVDVASDRITLDQYELFEGLRVRVRPGSDGIMPTGVSRYDFYYVVNLDGQSFQIAEQPGGEALTFDGTPQNLYVELADYRPMQYDPGVHYWQVNAAANLAEAAQYGHDQILPWLSPSLKGRGSEYLEKNFFRMQLDWVFENADGVNIYNPPVFAATLQENQGWWEALTEFIDYIETPTQFTITVNSQNDMPTSSGIEDLVMPVGTTIAEVDLRSYFSDPEDGQDLDFRIADSVRPQAFESISIVDGRLRLEVAQGHEGIAFLTVAARDSAGLEGEDTFMVQVGHMWRLLDGPHHESAGNEIVFDPPTGGDNGQPPAIPMGISESATVTWESTLPEVAVTQEGVAAISEHFVPTQQAQSWHSQQPVLDRRPWDQDEEWWLDEPLMEIPLDSITFSG